MAKAVVKTSVNDNSVDDFLNTIGDEQKKKDSYEILKMMQKASGEKPRMWGSSLIGFGEITITSPSGRVVDWFLVGFSPRKANLSLYLNSKLLKDEERLAKLGKHKTGMGCLYIKSLAGINKNILEGLIMDTLKKSR